MNETERNAIWRLLGACEASGQTGPAYAAVMALMVGPTVPEVTIHGLGPNKIQTIKCVREHLGHSLRESKDLVESSLPIRINARDMTHAKTFAADLRAAGNDATP